MKSKARRTIEKWVKNNAGDPIYIAEGSVFMYPSSSLRYQDTNGMAPYHYIVVWLRRETAKKVYDEFACSCLGFWYSETDECKHVTDLKRQIEEGKVAIA
jgi:hypothetical protein